jgi:hypothetical protein
MSERVRGSVGRAFMIGGTHIFVGPGPKGTRLPVLAIKSVTDAKSSIVADFRNSTSAERFIEVLMATVSEAAPELSTAERAEVERFGIHEEDL